MSVTGHAIAQLRLADLTTLKVGGMAEVWSCANDDDVRMATSEAFRILGGGSNLLVHDHGVAERVVRLVNGYARIDDAALADNGWLGAAVPLPGLVRRARALGRSGLEGVLGIPAQLGGAIRMNAGTRFGEIAEVLEEVEVMRDGRVERLPAAALKLGYRHSQLPAGAVILRARLALRESTPERVAAAEVAVDTARRGQPKARSAGCAFTNPPGDTAGRLIDAAGLKGLRVGGAMIAFEHANFIINDGTASAADISTLLARVQASIAVPLTIEWRRWGYPNGDTAARGWLAMGSEA